MTEGRQKENTSPLQAGIAPEANFITLRSIAIGAVLSFFLNFLDVYATTMIRGAYLTLNFSTPAALFFFFFVVLANGLVALIRKPLALTQAEQITIYIMLIIACCIPGMGFTQFMIPCLVGSTYYATPENGWDEFYNQHIDTWMIPQGENVVRFFFEGLPQGASTPWVPWIYPLACWYGFFLALCAAMIFSMVILRKQWMDRERLVYPLAQVPMEMIQQEKGGIVGKPFFANKIMWTGFAVSFILLSVNGLHTYFPFFPDIERHTRLLLFRNEVAMEFWFNPPWIGFFYFVNLDISASIWVFYTLTTIQRGIFSTIGLQSTHRLDEYAPDPFSAHQGMGAIIVFVGVGLWVARGHLREVANKACRRDFEADDSAEILSYRQAFFGLLISLSLVAMGLWMSGLPLLMALIFTFGAMVLYLGLTRAVAEGGLPAMRPPITTASFLIAGAGTSSLGAEGLVALGFTYGWHAEIRSFVMSSVANGLKISQTFKGSKRRLFWVIIIAILVSLAASTYMTLHLSYKYGGINLNPLWYGWGAARAGPANMAPRIAGEPTGPLPEAWIFMGIGGSAMAVLMWARQHLLWWPLSPVGYMISANWKTAHIAFSAYLAWLIKLLLLKYGGPKLYRSARPFFMGLIVGEITAAAIWLVIDYITGHTDSFLTQI